MKFLVVNVNWIGDVLFSTFLVRCLRKKYPDAYIATLVPERVGEILENNPYLDEVITFDISRERRFPYVDLGLIHNLRGKRFTHSLHLHRSLTRKLWAYFSGIRKRIGYEEKLKGVFLTHKLTSQRDKIHRAFYYFNIAQPLGVEDDGWGLDFFLNEEELDSMKSFLRNHGLNKFYLIHIGANWKPKKWPLKYWIGLINLILQSKKVDIVITGAEQDREFALTISKHTENKPLILAGKTTIRELASLIKLSSLFIGVDSAPLHLASALSVPAIGIYGPTSPEITGPFRPG